MELLQAVILAGGLGTRLHPITEKIPKPLVSVGKFPFLHWQLLDLHRSGIRKVLLLTGYLGEQIEEYFETLSTPWVSEMQISYSKEPQPMGTGGALKFSLQKLPSQFFLLNGDSFLRLDYQLMQKEFAEHGKRVCVVVYDNHKPTPVPNNLKISGVPIQYLKEGGAVAGYNFVDAGVYLLEKSVIEEYSSDRFDLGDVMTQMIATHNLDFFEVHEKFYDIGTVARLKEFEGVLNDYF
jgi:NDP-sugar pyrophosphorylase family protein